MGFENIADRLKKLPGKNDKQEAKKPVDIHELYDLRGRMLGVMLRDARMASGCSVEEIAAQLNVEPALVVEWEFGRQVPSLPQIELIAYYLKIPVSHFWSTATFQQQRAATQVDQTAYLMLRDRLIGALVRKAREQNGIQIETLAQQVGVTPAVFQLYELGQQPVPMTVLVSLASALNVNLDYFLEDVSRVGTFFEVQEVAKILEEMSPEVRAFIAAPANHQYIKVAMTLAQMPTETLRALAGELLDITL